MTDSVVIRAFECPSKCSNSSSQREDSPIRTAAYPLGCTAIGKPHLAASSHQLILPEAVAKISAGPTRGATPLPAPCMEASNSLRETSIEKCHGCHSPDFHRPIIPAPPDHSRAPTRRSCGGRNPRNLNHAGTHPPLARLPRHPRHSRTPYHTCSPRAKRWSPPNSHQSSSPSVHPERSRRAAHPHHPITPALPTRRSCGGRNPRNLSHAGTHPPPARLLRHHSVTPVPPFRHSREGGNPRPKPSHDAPLRTQPPTPSYRHRSESRNLHQ